MIDDKPSRTAQFVAATRALGALLPDDAQLMDDPFGARVAGPGVAELVVTARIGDVIPPAGDKRPSGAMVLATGANRDTALKAANDALSLIRIETA